MHSNLFNLAAIVFFGVAAQWFSWRLKFPSILLLLIIGVIAGPVFGVIDPDGLFGPLLVPVVSLSVAVILFEGGMSLKIDELRSAGSAIWRLITLGALVTWILLAAAAYYLVGLELQLAVLIGALFIVTGPTVIGPLLRQVRPTGQVGAILKWEGIVSDPIGALLAVLVFETIQLGELHLAPLVLVLGVLKTALVGTLIGIAGAVILLVLIMRFLIPDFLHSPATLAVVSAVFAVSNMFQQEAGLLAVTVMGLVIANQKRVPVKHIVEFKENLRVLLISGLFIVLAARVSLRDFADLGLAGFAFVLFTIFISRPAAVFFSTARTNLSAKEKIFLSAVAPRGIVAAAVSSVFALRLAEKGFAQAPLLVTLTFAVIVGTILFSGIAALPIARKLELAQPDRQGVLFVGAHPLSRAMASAVKENGFPVLLVDTNWDNISDARMAGLPAHYGSIISDKIMDEIDLEGLQSLLAVTPNDEVNCLAVIHFMEIFGRGNVYQAASSGCKNNGNDEFPVYMRGRTLFGANETYATLSDRYSEGAVKVTRLTDRFTFSDFNRIHGPGVIPLFRINEHGKLQISAGDGPIYPMPGDVVICLVPVRPSVPTGK